MRKYFLRHLNDNESIHRFVLLSGTIFVLVLASLVNISAYGLSLVVVGNLILSIFLERKREHPVEAFRILSLVCYSFLLFYILQSPIFPAEFIALEIAYFLIKLLSVLIVVLLLIKKRNNLASVTILFLHYFDCILIRFINLDFVKTQTEYYSIFEFTSLLYFYGFISLIIIERFPQLRAYFSHSLFIAFTLFAMANYWSAGEAKLLLDGGALSWLSNETFMTALRASEWGLMVINPYEWINANFAIALEYLGNFIVFLSQITASITMFFIPLIPYYALLFDIFHILVGLAAGVWFYKWMWITTLIIYFRKEIHQSFILADKYTRSLLVILMLIAPSIMTMEPLGWYEIRQGDLITTYGTNSEGEEQLHPQFFGSAAFPITSKYTHNAFKHGAQFHFHATLQYDELESAKVCGYSKIENPYFREVDLKRVEEITLRLLQDRPWLSSLMISIQPWHILIPNFGIDASLMGTKYESITFRLNSICFNREGKVVRREKLDELVIKKESMISDHYSIYFLWIGEKLSRVSDKNPYKDKLEEILENMSSYLQADMENSQQKSL